MEGISLLALLEIEQDWTIITSTGNSYGLQGADGGVTLILMGNSSTIVPLHIYAVGAILAAGLTLLVCLCVLAVGRILHRKPREQS